VDEQGEETVSEAQPGRYGQRSDQVV